MTLYPDEARVRTWLRPPTSAAMLLPGLLLVLTFLVLPFIWTLVISLTNQQMLGPHAASWSWVGLDNYARLFDPATWLSRGGFGWSLWLTVQFVLCSAVLGQAALGLALAWTLYGQHGVVREAVFSLAIVAWILPDTVVAFAWLAILHPDQGAINVALGALGLGQPDWLYHHAMLALVLFNAWRGAAFSMLLFSAALAGIPPSYLEVATVTGASGWQKFRDLVLPLLQGAIITDLMLVILWTFNTFTPFLLTGGGPSQTTEVLSIYTYHTAFEGSLDFGRGAAISTVVLLVNLLLGLVFLAYVRRHRLHP